ncbi:MAG: indole-3-glycerol phosphate synthase TrpC [Ignavibacteria bacterium]|nr:indole-3-glycerol phosphate synthase TrpC [Ignavibacteria bacterium]
MTILETILEDKRKEVAAAKKVISKDQIIARAIASGAPRPFKRALNRVPFALIAEIKRASPSKGTLVEHFDHTKIAVEFRAGGAHALSVLTDTKYFGGDQSYIQQVKEVVDLPILRKDFIVDEYQVYESRALGADAILLIVRALTVSELRLLHECAGSLAMAVLVETHTEMEIEIANSIGAEIIGVNNRDLSTFEVNISTSLTLFPFIRSDALAVSESGISSAADVLAVRQAGFRAALIGEGVVTRADRAAAVRELIPR